MERAFRFPLSEPALAAGESQFHLWYSRRGVLASFLGRRYIPAVLSPLCARFARYSLPRVPSSERSGGGVEEEGP